MKLDLDTMRAVVKELSDDVAVDVMENGDGFFLSVDAHRVRVTALELLQHSTAEQIVDMLAEKLRLLLPKSSTRCQLCNAEVLPGAAHFCVSRATAHEALGKPPESKIKTYHCMNCGMEVIPGQNHFCAGSGLFNIKPADFPLWPKSKLPQPLAYVAEGNAGRATCAVCGCEIPGDWSNAGQLHGPTSELATKGADDEFLALCPTDYGRVVTAVREMRPLPQGQTKKRP